MRLGVAGECAPGCVLAQRQANCLFRGCQRKRRGYLFGLLGGLLGIAIGAMLIQSKAKDAYGDKVQKYTSGSRWHGFAILLLSSIMFAVVTQMTG